MQTKDKAVSAGGGERTVGVYNVDEMMQAMGFEYVGFEIDEEYYNKAVERLETVKAQASIFDMGVSHFEMGATT